MTFKQKNRYLLLATLLFGLITYAFAIRNTLNMSSKVNLMEGEIKNASSAPERIAVLESNLLGLDAKMHRYLFDSTQNQEYIMAMVTKFCSANKLILKEFPQLTVKDETDLLLETTTIIVQGSFVDMLKLIYYFEQKAKTGRITSVRYASGMDYKTRKKTLTATIFLQNIRKKV